MISFLTHYQFKRNAETKPACGAFYFIFVARRQELDSRF